MEDPAKRHRVLFVAEAVTLAHVARANVLARTLDPALYEVHAAWDPRYNSLLGDLPFTFHPIHSLPSQEFLKRLARGVPMHDVQTLRDYVKEDVEVITNVGPDVVVGDFRLSLAASARMTGVTLVAIANAYWSPYGRQTFQFSEYDYPLSRVVGARLARSLFRALRPVGFAMHTRPLNVVLRENNLPGIGGDIRVMYTFGDYTAYADIPELAPTYDAPTTHRHIGAVLWSPDVPTPTWWRDLPVDRPIVYATLGSSGEEDALALVLEALADLPATVIAATAGRARIPRPPANARVADFVPGTLAAARASLVICNGGSPTTYQALAAGVPVLGLPGTNMDQHLNMEGVRRAGAGETLGAGRLTAAGIRGLATRILGAQSYIDAAKTLAKAHLASDFRDRFPTLIGQAVSWRGPYRPA